ncbi:twin transmembrane helix small protein [Marinobacterium sedimentorum]|uniref:twin transmembrane helix small protein n=1 Tax=Marinobacterium sedimentorum TaxID=2927804 RepID=UPI0020C6BC63|nr:twin transmembrane helix small protein [Marinobacterium sedimentorum]MCP8688473.1 twin transmembrane helix small protein [Marinobacterium sedimentorum]
MLLKPLIAVLFIAILVSLFCGLYFLLTDRGRSNRTVNSLFLRVGFSVLLLLVLIYGFYTGELGSHTPWLNR